MRVIYAIVSEEGEALYHLLDSCQKGNARSQDRLYKMYYGYAMGICLRYSQHREEAVEILNDGFVKIFTKLQHYTPGLSFKGWLRKIMIHTAIDHFRQQAKHSHHVEISFASQYVAESATALDQLSEKEILEAIQSLPPSYRIVFNLFVIEGYKHEEIARQLDIGVGTSKSNLAIARTKLQKMLVSSKIVKLEKRDG